MHLPKFEYLKPHTIDQACSMLHQHEGEAKIIAGSTALLIYLKQRLLAPRYIVGLKGISGLDYIDYDGEQGLRIGPLTTLYSLSVSPVIRERYPILSQVSAGVGVPPVRYMGTLGGNLCLDTRCLYYNQSHLWRRSRLPCFRRGGNLCHAVKRSERCHATYQGDLAPALMALNANVKLSTSTGQRIVALGDFFTGKGETPNVLQLDEILTEVQIPPPSDHSVAAYHKLRIREAMDFPLAAVAVVLNMDGEKVCREAKVVLNAISAAPFEVKEAAAMLQGKEIGDGVIEEAAQETFKRAHPVNNLPLDPAYRRKMVPVLLKRAIRQALASAKQS